MSRFKVGDSVRGTHGHFGNHRHSHGERAVVITPKSGDYVRVRFADGYEDGYYESTLQLITKGGDMKPTQRKTYKQLKESVTVKKHALWQEACDDGTQEYVLLNADDNKDPRQTQKIYERALVEEDPKNFVEVFAVTPAFMTQAELDQWEDFKLVEKRVAKTGKPTSKPRVAKVAPVKAMRGRKVKKAA